MQNRTWTTIGLSPVFLPSRTRIKETCFEYKIQSCYAVNDLHGPAKNGVKSYMNSHSRSRNATSDVLYVDVYKKWGEYWNCKMAFWGQIKSNKLLPNELSCKSQNHWGIYISISATLTLKYVWKMFSSALKNFFCYFRSP